jgi:hypothetical protein
MEICILQYDGSYNAEDNLKEVMDLQGKQYPWLHDVGTIARPLVGRVRIGVTFPDGQSKTFREGDLANTAEALGGYTGYYVSSLFGPLSSMFATVNAGMEARAAGDEAEQRLFHLDEIKKALPRDSSALVLIAQTDVCDAMVKLFEFSEPRPKVIRRQAADELRKRLEALHRMLAQGIAAGVAKAEGAGAATH